MLKTRRQPGDRRWGLHVDYPLRDSGGLLVLADRRRLPDRRGKESSVEQWITLLSRFRHEDT